MVWCMGTGGCREALSGVVWCVGTGGCREALSGVVCGDWWV